MDSTNIAYQTEQAKQSFQYHLTGLLEAQADLLNKIAFAKGSKKAGIWLEMSEAELLSGYILEAVSNLAGDYKIIANVNKLLETNYLALQQVERNNIRRAIQDFKNDRIDKDQFRQRVNEFVDNRKMKIV